MPKNKTSATLLPSPVAVPEWANRNHRLTPTLTLGLPGELARRPRTSKQHAYPLKEMRNEDDAYEARCGGRRIDSGFWLHRIASNACDPARL